MPPIRVAVAIAALPAALHAQAQSVTVTLTEWKMGTSKDTVNAGAVTFRVSNGGSMNQELYVKGSGVDKGTRELAKGESASLTVTLKAGTYELYCPLSDGSHKMAGMTKTLVVVAAPAKKP